MTNELISKVFAAVDATDATRFSRFFAETGRMTFGNAEPMVGAAAIDAGVKAFFETIRGLRHQIVNEWVAGNDFIIELAVSYDRLDGRTVDIPAVGIWHLDAAGLIDDYRVFVDLAPVYA